MASRLKAQKNASASHGHGNLIKKGDVKTDHKASVGLDSMAVKSATSVPKRDVEKGIHKACKTTAPQMATFGNDRSIESGEFESSPEQSTADTGIAGTAVIAPQSGEFESSPSPSYADTHSHH